MTGLEYDMEKNLPMVEHDIQAVIQLHYQGDLAIMATKMLDVSISFIGRFIQTFKAGNIISAIGNSVKSLVEMVDKQVQEVVETTNLRAITKGKGLVNKPHFCRILRNKLSGGDEVEGDEEENNKDEMFTQSKLNEPWKEKEQGFHQC